MRIRPLALAAAAALTASLATATATATTAGAADRNDAGTQYVALGDSYSAGVGSGSALSGGVSGCGQTTGAYPYLYDQATAPGSFSFQACGGAVTSDVVNNQLGTLGPGTTLVSITVGGNDVGFSSVMETCLTSSDSTCLSTIATAEQEARNQLPAKLDTTYAAIRAKAPNADVVVLGYPEFYDTAKGSCLDLMDAAKRAAVDQGADLLNGVVRGEAAKYAGFGYIDVVSRFAGHEICDSSPWINNWYGLSGPFHPTTAGQTGGYLPAFESGI
ncbi:hypothetical protein BIV57_10400 [Mangrovactinospora gilvigrisea]|uniref:SGNH hydrolase-type esterase domain-containing protein n=1 Tax=Mangrovactinospora gilvigrisea TaxID=1428644 RepID=A0A1J7CD11_9ACTN|nr:SGNH/GDSL hydrolase family protein [Mangrovactinospora gilvigrisea]OIV37562.1 hypothetical protein BIV57_10400 [Mangrovactinospora gilvigrisea]